MQKFNLIIPSFEIVHCKCWYRNILVANEDEILGKLRRFIVFWILDI